MLTIYPRYLPIVSNENYPKLRIAFITHYAELYGANRSLINLIDGLSIYGVSPFVILPWDGPLTEYLKGMEVPYFVIPIRAWFSEYPEVTFSESRVLSYWNWRYGTIRRLIRNLLALPRIIKKLIELRIDLVYTNSSIIPTGAFAAKLLRIPHIWHIREFGDLDYGVRYDWGGKGFFTRILNWSDAKIMVSNSIKDYFFSDQNKGYVIYNGIAWRTQFDQFYERYQKNDKQKNKTTYTFAIVGLFRPSKGQDVSIRAFSLVEKKYPNIRLLLAGSGEDDYIQECKQLVDELNLNHKIEFKGFINDPYLIYKQANTVLVCSKNEAMGRVTVEAMSACCSVIGNDRAGTSELIKHMVTGLLYNGGPQELAQSMIFLIENPLLERKLSIQGWETARELYSIDAYAENVYRVIESIVKAI